MPAKLDTFQPACWYDALPTVAPGLFEVLREPGWADQSALFFPEVYQPVRLPMLITASSAAGLLSQINALRKLRRTLVRADDSITQIVNVLVCAVEEAGPPERAVMIVGGSQPGDTWEQEIVVTILPPSPDIA